MINFSIKTFLIKTPQELLQKYFSRNNLFADFDWSKENWVDDLSGLLEQDGCEQVLLELGRINELTDDSGAEHIIERADLLFGIQLADTLREMSHHQQAMWTFLNHHDIFDQAIETEYIDNLTNWKICNVGCNLSCGTDEEIKDMFGAAIAEHFLKKGKGRHCDVDYYPRKNPDRHCFFAYPEDYIKGTVVYENGKRTTQASRPAFEVIFIYDPAEGVLRTHAPRGGSIEPMQDIFCKKILGLKDGVPDKNTQVYDLSPLKNPNFRFTW